MRTKIITIYKFSELSDDAKQTAIKYYRDNKDEIFWQDEILESLKTLFKFCDGVKLVDWSLGLNNSYISVSFSNDETEELSGKRAWAWVENNLFYKLRYKAGIKFQKERVWMSDNVKHCTNPEGAFIHHIGELKECEFTGVCYDEDFLDSLRKDIKDGCDLKTAFKGLAATYQMILNNENDDQNSDEYISEHLEANEYEYNEDGNQI